jgi:hypothetical protein
MQKGGMEQGKRRTDGLSCVLAMMSKHISTSQHGVVAIVLKTHPEAIRA